MAKEIGARERQLREQRERRFEESKKLAYHLQMPAAAPLVTAKAAKKTTKKAAAVKKVAKKKRGRR